MSIPDFQTCMLPFLEFVSDKKEHSVRETTEYLSNQFNLTDEEKKEMLPSGQQAVFSNRIGWARTYFGKAGLIEGTKWG
jgi:restriction system protein